MLAGTGVTWLRKTAGRNDLAVEAGTFILSVYRLGTERVWIVTEPSFRTTTIMLPEEY
jgi:hypothetical protein